MWYVCLCDVCGVFVCGVFVCGVFVCGVFVCGVFVCGMCAFVCVWCNQKHLHKITFMVNYGV